MYEYRRSYVGDGKKLKEILDSKGTNIRQIAKATRISATTLYSIIQKNSNIRFNFALRLANELEININDPWYETNAYSSSATLQSKMNTISSAYSELSKSRSEYVQFYMKNHEQIPTWIMIKVVNFSTFIDVLHNSKTNVTNAICKLYSMYDDNNLPNVKLLIGSLHWLRRVRNSCAHNERVYCIHQTQARNNSASGRILDPYYTQLPTSYSRCTEKNIFDILVYFKYFLPTEEFTPMIIELKNMLIELQNTLQTNAFDNVRGQMGIKNLNVLDALIALPKSKIEYHKFDTL